MDNKRHAIALLFWFVAGSAQSKTLPKQLSWLAQDANLKIALLSPRECMSNNISIQELNQQITLGRLAFQSPALLGGQAARKGLSCESCHNSARGNPYFFIENISSKPGTADVSESFFSSTGGDDEFMPVPIPDLADLSQMEIIDRTSSAFRQKIIDLVAVEFDGQKPSVKVLDAIQMYLLNIDQKYCQDFAQVQHKGWLYDWDRLIETAGLIEDTFASNDSAHRDFLIRVARLILETIHDRFAISGNEAIQKELIKSSKDLAKVARVNSAVKGRKLLEKWNHTSKQLKLSLEQNHKKSAYNIDMLIQYIEGNQNESIQ